MTIIQVKIIPNSCKNCIVGWQGKFLKIRIKAPPEKGKANNALIEFLSRELSISKKDISILSGHTFCNKLIKIDGKDLNEIKNSILNKLDQN